MTVTTELSAADMEFVARKLEQLAQGYCVHCGEAIESAVQVGNSAYAEPCGHRQGQMTAEWLEAAIARREASE